MKIKIPEANPIPKLEILKKAKVFVY